MRSKLVVFILVGAVIGLCASSLLKQSEAQGQVKQEKQAWEYKVEFFRVSENKDKQAEDITKFASEGWEYVGLLVSGQGDSGYPAGHVLFKRLKK
jgi:hypothetical protein